MYVDVVAVVVMGGSCSSIGAVVVFIVVWQPTEVDAGSE